MLSALELRRQIFHLFFGIILVTLLYFNVLTTFYLFLLLAFGFALSFLSRYYDLPIIAWFLDRFERPEDRYKFPGKGPIFFVIGSLIVLILFSKATALASMVILTTGDAVSHVAGKLLSKRTYVYLKSWEGMVAGIMLAFASALFFVDSTPALLGSIVAMAVEGLKLGLDDNLILPVSAAIVISLI